MVIGLAHDRILYLGMEYLDRGWITDDEYENLINYLYEPDSAMGGNGSAKHIIERIKLLPVHKPTYKPGERNK